MYTEQYLVTQYGNRPVIVYDGECPMCNAYVKMGRFKQHGDVVLLDARNIPTSDLKQIMLEYNLNDGMLFRMDGQISYGHEALNKITLLTTKNTFFNKINRMVFASPAASKILYPFMVKGRLLLLYLLGRSRIGE